MASPLNGNTPSANGALFELLSVYPQVGREDLNILYIMQDLLYTVQNIIAGIASVSRVYHEDECLSKFEINLGKGRPLVMLQYKDTVDNNDAESEVLQNDEMIPGCQQTSDEPTYVKMEDEVCLDTNSCVSETSVKVKPKGKDCKNDYYFDAMQVCKNELSSELTIVDSTSSEVENFNNYNEKIFTPGAGLHTEVERSLSVLNTQDVNDGTNNFNLEQEVCEGKPENTKDKASLMNSATHSLSNFNARRKTKRLNSEIHSNFSPTKKILQKTNNSNTSDFESPALNLRSKNSLKISIKNECGSDTESLYESRDVYQATDEKGIEEPKKNLSSVKIVKDKKQLAKCDTVLPPVTIFPCKFCDRSFHWLSKLQIHERVHTGEKPYACKYCDKTFSQGGSKKRHEEKHLEDNLQMWKMCASTLERN